MEQNNISLIEISKLMKEVRLHTDEFISGLKSSIWIEKDGELKNPQFVQIRFFDPTTPNGLKFPADSIIPYYTIAIDGCSFKLNGETAIYNLMDFNKDKELEGQQILNRNGEVITKSLIHLQSSEPQYFVAFTNTRGYMGFVEKTDEYEVQVINCNEISVISASPSATYKVSFNIVEDDFIIETAHGKIPIKALSEGLGEQFNIIQLTEQINAIFDNTMINIDKLPLVLKTRLHSKGKSI